MWTGFEPICLETTPELVLVYGDVNSTVAAALVAAKLGIRVGHVEAGLRSRDWSMPEEINRVVTDRVSDLLFAPSRDAVENLAAEGVRSDRVHLVGNVMIDSLGVAVRRGTEGRITCRGGTNRLAPPERGAIRQAAAAARSRRRSTPATIERWDGKAAERIAAVICDGARFD